MATTFLNTVIGKKRKAQDDLYWFKQQSKARRLLTIEDDNQFGNILGAYVCAGAKQRKPKGQNEPRSANW